MTRRFLLFTFFLLGAISAFPQYNDRAINWNNELRPDTKYFSRSLNAQSRVNNYSLYFTYHFDNDALLNRSAWLAPYLRAGIGLTAFQVFGDLYYGAGQSPCEPIRHRFATC